MAARCFLCWVYWGRLGVGREEIGREYVFLTYFYIDGWKKKVRRKCYWDCLLQEKLVSLFH